MPLAHVFTEALARMSHSVVDGSAEATVTKVFGLIGAGIAGIVSVTTGWNAWMRSRRMKAVDQPGASMTTASSKPDEPVTTRVIVQVDRAEIDDAEIKRLTWERDESRRLYGLAQDDLGKQQRATLQAQATVDVLRRELDELRRAINSGNTRLHEPTAGHVVHVREEYAADLAVTPPLGMRTIRSKT